MIEITENLFIGNDIDFSEAAGNFTIIHACKTCHQKGVGYSGNLSSSDPHYLIFASNNENRHEFYRKE